MSSIANLAPANYSTYRAVIDDGNGGETEFRARSLRQAVRAATAWTKAGRWDDAGTARLVVMRLGATGEIDRERIAYRSVAV